MDKKRITIIFLIVLTNAMAATAILPMLPIYIDSIKPVVQIYGFQEV